MTTPYRRGSEPGASGNPVEDIFPDLPPPWSGEWILTAGAAASEDTENVLVGRNMTLGASGILGATGGATGASGTPVTVSNKSSMPNLHQRDQGIVTAVYQGAVPMLGAWEGAAEALNRLLGGFSSLEQFIETLVKVLTGADVDLSFITEGARVFLELLQSIFGPIGAFFQQLWETIGEDIFLAITDFLGWVWNLFSEIAADLEMDVRPILESVTNILKVLWETFGDVIEAILQPVSDFLKWLFTNFGTVIETVIKPIINWLVAIWGSIGGPLLSDIAAFLTAVWETIGEPALLGIFGTLSTLWNTFDEVVIDNLIGFFVNLVNGNLLPALEAVGDFFKGIIDQFGSIGAGLFNGLPTFADLGALATNLLGDVFETVGGWVLGILNTLTGGLFTVITDALGALITWATTLPGIGPLLSALIPDEWENAAGLKATSFVDLKEYAAETLNTSSVLYSQNLQGQVPADIFPVISPGFVGDTRPNLIADGGFRSAAAVQSGSGWSWDSATSRTSGDGGSAKVTGDGGVKQMFSNLVAVSPGQELECSVWARWTKPSASRPTISVGVRGYLNDAVVFTQPVGSVANVVPDSSGYSGNVGGWVLLSGVYKIPASQSLTHVRLVLSVLNGPAGLSAWFDDASLRKVSLIGPKLVGGVGTASHTLADDIENAVGVEQYDGLLRAISRKTGYTLEDVRLTVEDFLDGDSTVSGDQIKAGDISSAYISELSETWDKIKTGVDGPGAVTNGSLQAAYDALNKWNINITDHGSLILNVAGGVNSLNSRLALLETSITQWKDYSSRAGADARSALQQLGQTPTTPPTPPGEPTPVFAESNDNFDRTTGLGSGWTISQKSPGGAFGAFVTDGSNAFWDAPDFMAVDQIAAAVRANSVSRTDYQRVYCSLGSAPGNVAPGGYNDLIGRAASGVVCIVARFYNNAAKTVRLFYRNGTFEPDAFFTTTESRANQFATFNYTGNLTSGTMIEFYIGNKSASDATKCFVKVGTWTSGIATIGASALSVMGRGWGFGGGNCTSLFGPQEMGKVNVWGAQDQI